MIDSYSFGSIAVDGKTYKSDVIIYPDRIDGSWWRESGHSLCAEDISDIVKESPDVLIVGTGQMGAMKIPDETKQYIESLGIELIAKRTKAACEEYNRLREGRKVVAALHLTC